jgi:hypothetical protein
MILSAAARLMKRIDGSRANAEVGSGSIKKLLLQWHEKYVDAGKTRRRSVYLFILWMSLRKRTSTCSMI